MAQATETTPAPIQHRGEERSNEVRRQIAALEPHCLRTFTPSLAVLSKSAGCYHVTPEGRTLADFSSGVLVANLGHNPASWWRRVISYMGLDQLASGDAQFVPAVPLTAYNALTEVEAEACRRLIASLQSQPGGACCEQVMWAASGSEAIQKALWACLDHRPEADIILATRHGFHGKKGLAGAVTGSESDHDRDPRVRFLSFPMQECLNLERRRQPLDLAPYEAELAALKEELGDRLCCLITEPYLGGGGSFHPQREYMQMLANFCKENGLIFILDEVQANFGRTGEMYAFTHYGVEPDIVVLGKGMANGIAVSAACGRAEIFGSMQFGEGSDTWSANPLASAAVLATLDEFEQQDVLAQGRVLAQIIEDSLVKLSTLDCIANIRGEGTVWGVECAAVGNHSAAQVAQRCVEACYLGDTSGKAIHLLGPLAGTVIRVSPPLVMPADEAQDYFAAMHRIFDGVSKELASG